LSAPTQRSAELDVENAIGLILAVAVFVYLVYALLAPERLG
jgi:K+-transporting ATPase KdpF subunit